VTLREDAHEVVWAFGACAATGSVKQSTPPERATLSFAASVAQRAHKRIAAATRDGFEASTGV